MRDGAYTALSGYKYQFDRTIMEIYNNPSKQINIEQLEDYGIDNCIVQVKYHNTDYSNAQQKQMIKKPVLQLLNIFKKNKQLNFVLYIYLKGVQPRKVNLNISELNSLIGNSSITDNEKAEFLKKFTLIHAEDFQTQYTRIIERIKTEYAKLNEEAEIYYSIISSHLLDIVTKNSPQKKTNRTISKKEIDHLIKSGKQIIFKSTFLELRETEQHLKYLKRFFFNPTLNKEPFERIFIIEIEKSIVVTSLKEIIYILKKKWSKNNSKTIPESDRFAPYIFFRGIDENLLAQLKEILQKEENIIKDGYDFFNASFNPRSIKERPTFANKIFFKFINSQRDLELFLETNERNIEIYEFFTNKPIPLKDYSVKHAKIEIKNIEEIKGII